MSEVKEATITKGRMADQIIALAEQVREGSLEVILTMETVKGKNQVVLTFYKG